MHLQNLHIHFFLKERIYIQFIKYLLYLNSTTQGNNISKCVTTKVNVNKTKAMKPRYSLSTYSKT